MGTVGACQRDVPVAIPPTTIVRSEKHEEFRCGRRRGNSRPASRQFRGAIRDSERAEMLAQSRVAFDQVSGKGGREKEEQWQMRREFPAQQRARSMPTAPVRHRLTQGCPSERAFARREERESGALNMITSLYFLVPVFGTLACTGRTTCSIPEHGASTKSVHVIKACLDYAST
jgi:hypothetical protein